MRGVWVGVATAAALCAGVAHAAGPMSVAEFLAKGDALKAKGMLAIGSPDIALLRDTVKDAGQSYRAEIASSTAAGKKPRACPPPVGQAKIDGKTLMGAFASIPPAKRGISVKAAFYRFMDRRYPCP